MFEYVLAGHAVHSALPEMFLKKDALHGWHAKPSGPVKPGRQVQFSVCIDPRPENVFAGH